MFKKEEIDFVRLFVALLYQNGYCYFDVSKEYLDDYLHELKKIMENKKMFLDHKCLENIFKYDEYKENYDNFINLILYVVSFSNDSYIVLKSNIIIINLSKKELNNMLTEDTNINVKLVEQIVELMINYLNYKIKVKVITNKIR